MYSGFIFLKIIFKIHSKIVYLREIKFKMSSAELKLNIINQIANLKNIAVIEQIQRLLDFELQEDTYKLSEEQEQRVFEAREEYSKGKILSDKQANSEIDKWLNEQ